MTRIGLIIAMFGLLGFSASATNELVLQRDYSAQPRQLIVCSFDPSVLAHGFSDKQLDEVDWAGYLKRNITITELSRFRSATHVPTAMGRRRRRRSRATSCTAACKPRAVPIAAPGIGTRYSSRGRERVAGRNIAVPRPRRSPPRASPRPAFSAS